MDSGHYITRDLEGEVLALSGEYPIVLVTGTRQAGKTTLLRHLNGGERAEVTLDDLNERRLAREDPELFLQLHPAPVIIDEVQYAPELFPFLKILADRDPGAMGRVWLTGSQPFPLMRLAGESLAGRAGIAHLLPLSQHEVHGTGPVERLTLDVDALRERMARREPATLPAIYERIWRGSMPAVVSGRHSSPNRFYASYQQTYLERDVRALSGGVDLLDFDRFMQALAAQVGQLLNVDSLSRDVGQPRRKVEEWLSILERSDVVFRLQPYSNNALSRAVKAPKVYFNDTGLVAWLGRWSSAKTLQAGAMAGPVLENYVVSEVRKAVMNAGDPARLWFYRDRDGREIDILLERDGTLYPLEVKRTANPQRAMVRSFGALECSGLRVDPGAVICLKQELGALPGGTLYVPVWAI